MAQRADLLEPEQVLRDYLRSLARDGNHHQSARSPGHDLRTCASCGRRTAFTMEPEGTWFRCTVCGQYA